MDNFPMRRGIGLSRTQQPHIQPPNFYRQPNKLPQSFNRTLPSNLTGPTRPPHFQIELNQPNPVKTHHKAASGNILNIFPQKTPLTEAVNFPQMHKHSAIPTYPLDNNAFKIPVFSPTPMGKDQPQQDFFASDPKSQKKAFQFNLTLEDNAVSKDTAVTLDNRSRAMIEPLITSPRLPVVPLQPNANSNSGLKMQQQSLINERIQEVTAALKLEAAAKEKAWSERLENIEKENQELKQQLRLKEADKGMQHIQAENQALKQQLTQKSTMIKQTQQKTRLAQQQLKSKLSTVEYELRLLKGNKNRLQIEIQSNKKLVKSQRQKNEKTKQQMNKLIFFQDDLIHAKDYQKLKDQLEYVLSENTKLFEQHQKYIIQVGEQRKITEASITELSTQLKKLKIEYGEYREKISQVLQGGDDKMIILKLQAQINFLKKKNQDLNQQLYTREKQLEQALMDIKELNSKDNQKQESSRNVLDEFNVRQIQETVAMYESRLQDLNQNLERKQRETEKQKKTIELLTSELRHVREDKHINSMKGKSNEDSLKNQVQILQKGHQTELQLKNKKICNLQDCILRKSKEITQKDKFIKDFLLTRIKQLESSSPDELLTTIKQYFQPEQGLRV